MLKKVLLTVLLIFFVFFLQGCSFKRRASIKPLGYTPKALSYFYYMKYLELERKGDKNAVRFLKKAIDSYPVPDLYLEAGRFYLKKKNLKAAEDFVKKGLQRFPGEKDLTFFLYRLYILKNQKQNALTLLKVYLKKHPNDKEALKNLAFLYFEEKKYKEAVEILKKIPVKDPTVYYFLAQSYIRLKNHSLAITYLKKAVQLKEDFLRAWAELGYQLELVNDYAGAEEAYYYLYKKGLKNNEIRLKLVELNIKLNNLEKAFLIIEESPKDPDFLFKASVFFVHEGFYDWSEKVLTFVSPPYPPKILYLKAYLLYKRHNKLQDAISLLNKIPERAPVYKDALVLMVRLYLDINDISKAVEIARKGQRLFNDEDFWILEEEVWYSKKKYFKALEVINKAIKLFPESAELLYQKGMIMYKLKKVDESINIMEQVLKLSPDHADALNFIGYTLAEEGKDLDRALDLISRALKKQPTNGYYLDSLAWVYYKKGDISKAWEIIKKAVKKVKDDPIIWEHYGDIALSLRKFKEALRGYKNALKFKPEKPWIVKKKLKRLR